MKTNPYLNFNGNCREALTFYADLLGGKVLAMMTFAGSPMEGQVSEGFKEKIIHGRIAIGDDILMGSDSAGEYFSEPKGFAVAIGVDTAEEAERIYAALAEGGEASMPIAETFWAVRFGMCKDRFGIPWMVNCENRQ